MNNRSDKKNKNRVDNTQETQESVLLSCVSVGQAALKWSWTSLKLPQRNGASTQRTLHGNSSFTTLKLHPWLLFINNNEMKLGYGIIQLKFIFIALLTTDNITKLAFVQQQFAAFIVIHLFIYLFVKKSPSYNLSTKTI